MSLLLEYACVYDMHHATSRLDMYSIRVKAELLVNALRSRLVRGNVNTTPFFNKDRHDALRHSMNYIDFIKIRRFHHVRNSVSRFTLHMPY